MACATQCSLVRAGCKRPVLKRDQWQCCMGNESWPLQATSPYDCLKLTSSQMCFKASFLESTGCWISVESLTALKDQQNQNLGCTKPSQWCSSVLPAPSHSSSFSGARNGHQQLHMKQYTFSLELVWNVLFLCNVFSKWKKMLAEKCWLICLGKGGNNSKSTNAETFGERRIWANTGAAVWMSNLDSLCYQ